MAKLSVNINKIATLRNSRGGNSPNVIGAVVHCQKYGADGITVHPRPDERHIRYQDVREIAPHIYTELNIEGNPKYLPFVDLVLETMPTQVTLVPDIEGQLTSDHGWNTIEEFDYLKSIVALFKSKQIRVSIFLDPNPKLLASAKEIGADRIELYTEFFASNFEKDKEKSIIEYKKTAIQAFEMGLGINAGHDLNLNNLNYFSKNIPTLLEVSIGHALISDSLYYGLENTIQMYKRLLN